MSDCCLRFFRGKDSEPEIEVICCYDEAAPHYGSVVFHINEVVKNTTIKIFLIGQWENLIETPHECSGLVEIEKVKDLEELRKIIRGIQRLYDANDGGPNNWRSAFFMV